MSREPWVILAVDPGETTGYLVATLTPDPNAVHGIVTEHTHPLISGFTLTSHMWNQFIFDTAPEEARIVARAAGRAADRAGIPHTRIAVVVENFIITRNAMMANATWSSEVTGIVKAMATVEIPGHYWDKSQKSAEMKNVIHDRKVLQEMGLKRRGAGITTHMADAMGHALLFSARYRNGLIKPR